MRPMFSIFKSEETDVVMLEDKNKLPNTPPCNEATVGSKHLAAGGQDDPHGICLPFASCPQIRAFGPLGGQTSLYIPCRISPVDNTCEQMCV